MKRRTKIVGFIFGIMLSALVFTGCIEKSGENIPAPTPNLQAESQKQSTSNTITLSMDSSGTITRNGYSITVNQIGFFSDATRVAVTCTNNGKNDFFILDAKCIQNRKQYSSEFDIYYDEPEGQLLPGAYTEGVFSFPLLQQDDFRMVVDVGVNSAYEDLEPFTFIFSAPDNGTLNNDYDGYDYDGYDYDGYDYVDYGYDYD